MSHLLMRTMLLLHFLSIAILATQEPKMFCPRSMIAILVKRSCLLACSQVTTTYRRFQNYLAKTFVDRSKRRQKRWTLILVRREKIGSKVEKRCYWKELDQ